MCGIGWKHSDIKGRLKNLIYSVINVMCIYHFNHLKHLHPKISAISAFRQF